ncbi:thioredoxin family protein [Croceitalea marina]|uniref:Thioredoxin family protein n=1 Tax=Croceitalea marina TaxID=1775166 RepID=A0ABW5MWF1_9FLAO
MQTTQDTNTIDIINESLSRSWSYEIYREKVHELAMNGKTTGEVQSEALINYTQLNDRRMNRWDKTLKIPAAIQESIGQLNKNLLFLVITESWCGDASPSLPVINKIAQLNPNIELRIVLRDENLDLMNRFLTNNARSIPKLIIVDHDTEEVIADWGPRPSMATKLVEDYKTLHGMLTPEFKQDLQVWYNKDKGQNTLSDIVGLLPLK